MPVHVCSLIVDVPQPIPNDGEYHVLRFPFTAESYDAYTMHQAVQPDGTTVTDWSTSDRSGLIWPDQDGWGSLTGVIYWDSGDYTEVRDRFVRDPLNLSTGYDSTATEDWAITPGGQYRHKSHEMFVHPGTPVSLMVRQNASTAVAVSFAEFKLAIHT
ncbi:hypothetical protein OK074_3638 [Actinobacteria bacterium OK074]|nr:hypothetical protein OK074_3638 [Actinobacteria bacterium OK074]